MRFLLAFLIAVAAFAQQPAPQAKPEAQKKPDGRPRQGR